MHGIHSKIILLSSKYLTENQIKFPLFQTTKFKYIRVGLWVLNITFNNIMSEISCGLVLLVGETRVPGENHRSATSHWQTLSHYVLYKKTPCNGQESNFQIKLKGRNITIKIQLDIKCRNKNSWSICLPLILK